LLDQGGHKPGKPEILRDFSEHGIFREFCAISGKTDFALWVQAASSNPYSYAAKCIWSTKTVDLSNIG